MRVLFFGQTGVNKRPCVNRLGVHCLKANGLPPDLDNITARKHLRVFHLEDAIASAAEYIAYLDRFYQKAQQSIWSSAWDSVMSEINASNPENVFITLHATYFRRNRFFSVINTSQIREFSPDLIITLIDDAYECWDRIQVREAERPRGTKVRLRDVFLWRTVMALSYEDHYPLTIPSEEVREAVEDIDRQIEARDYRLIDQVQAVAAFRPNYRKHHARGVNAELLYAGQTTGVPVHVIWDDTEDGTYGDSPFGVMGAQHANLDGLIAAVRS